MGERIEVAEWIVGTAASRHICNNKSLFKSLDESVEDDHFYLANSDAVKVEGRGNISLLLASGKRLELSDVSYAPTMLNNIISVGKLIDVGFSLEFGSSKVVIIEKNGDFRGMGFIKHGVYVIDGLAQLD